MLTNISNGKATGAALGREELVVVVLTIGRTHPFNVVVGSESFTALDATEALWVPDSAQQIVSVLWDTSLN